LCRDISETALSSLPEEDILSGLKRLIAQSAFNLKKLPPPQRFTKLLQAELTYSSHCCAFQSMKVNGYVCRIAKNCPQVT